MPSNLFFILIFIIILLIIIFCFRSFRQLIVFWFYFSMFDLLEIVLCCFSYMMILVYFLNSSFDISFFFKKKLPLWFSSICFVSSYHNHMTYFMSFAGLLRIRSPFITQVMCLLHYLKLTHADFLSILIQIHTSKDFFF